MNKSSFNPLRMQISELHIHKVHLPELYVFADILSQGRLWPETIEHNGNTFKFVRNQTLPQLAVGNYSGYALYEIKDYVKMPPVSHAEFGDYLQTIGKIMCDRKVSMAQIMKECNQGASSKLYDVVLTSMMYVGHSRERAMYIEEKSRQSFKDPLMQTI